MTQHARERAKERYNLELSNKDMREIVQAIQRNDNRSFVCERGSRSRAMHLVWWKQRILVVVYSNETKNIRTLLPPERYYAACGIDGTFALKDWQGWVRSHQGVRFVLPQRDWEDL